MNVMTLQGLKGGVGTTTVTANLAAAINAQGLPVLVIDLSPQNSLRLHFSMDINDARGISTQIQAGLPWHEAAYVNENGVTFVPFGQDVGDEAINAFRKPYSLPSRLVARLAVATGFAPRRLGTVRLPLLSQQGNPGCNGGFRYLCPGGQSRLPVLY